MAKRSKVISAPKKDEAFVRMYRQGLGDCFLLTFRGDDGKPVHVLIDCGVWDNDAATLGQMAKVVENINLATGGTATKGGHIHLLVCTHEHWDHNSGFLQHRDLFEKMTIDNVWVAWTENPDDPLGAELKAEFAVKRNKLASAIDRVRSAHPSLADDIAHLTGVEFAVGAVAANPAEAMKWVRDRKDRGATLSYRSPGEVVPIPGATSAARALVLGPPRSRQLLRRNLATEKQAEAGDVYHVGMMNAFVEDAFFSAARHAGKTAGEIEGLGTSERELYEASSPFEETSQMTSGEVAACPLLRETYAGPGSEWRRIDTDWLNTAAQIALWMDSSTNNTSLVLAIELIAARKVLLFAADAQFGNWMSWRDVEFAAGEGATIDDLLARTVLYKVGHHGSHNATLRKDGLEKMTHAELVAMIPVNANSVQKKGWKMPFAPMFEALKVRTAGRIIRADNGIQSPPQGVSNSQWDEFEARCEEDPVYFSLRVK